LALCLNPSLCCLRTTGCEGRTGEGRGVSRRRQWGVCFGFPPLLLFLSLSLWLSHRVVRQVRVAVVTEVARHEEGEGEGGVQSARRRGERWLPLSLDADLARTSGLARTDARAQQGKRGRRGTRARSPALASFFSSSDESESAVFVFLFSFSIPPPALIPPHTSLFTLEERKPVIKAVDMSEDMQRDAVECATTGRRECVGGGARAAGGGGASPPPGLPPPAGRRAA